MITAKFKQEELSTVIRSLGLGITIIVSSLFDSRNSLSTSWQDWAATRRPRAINPGPRARPSPTCPCKTTPRPRSRPWGVDREFVRRNKRSPKSPPTNEIRKDRADVGWKLRIRGGLCHRWISSWMVGRRRADRKSSADPTSPNRESTTDSSKPIPWERVAQWIFDGSVAN